VRKVNLLSPDFDHSSSRDGYRWRAARVGKQLGSVRIGGTLYELGEGQRSFPYHLHHGMEEWALVVDGTPALRTAEGERTLARGDVVCFPAGAGGAHQLRGPGTVLLLSTVSVPETTEYEDSGKVGARPPGKIFRLADAADYWEGE
jgi:uncharacterized cupin superfamily protein